MYSAMTRAIVLIPPVAVPMLAAYRQSDLDECGSKVSGWMGPERAKVVALLAYNETTESFGAAKKR